MTIKSLTKGVTEDRCWWSFMQPRERSHETHVNCTHENPYRREAIQMKYWKSFFSNGKPKGAYYVANRPRVYMMCKQTYIKTYTGEKPLAYK